MTSRATARLFVAVDVPPAVREELAAWARDVASALGFREPQAASAPLRVLEPQAQHLTLCFLGSRPVEEIDTIGAAIGACAGYVGEVSVGAPLGLPPRRLQAGDPAELVLFDWEEGGEFRVVSTLCSPLP